MAAILKNRYDVITLLPIVWLLRNLADRCKMTFRWLCIHLNQNRNYNFNMAAVRFPKLEVVFISAVDWDISLKFGMQIQFHLLEQMQSLNLHPEVHFRLSSRLLEKSIWRHNSAADRLNTTKFGSKMQNVMPMTTLTSKLKLKYSSNMAAVRFAKPEVVLSQPWIEISYINLAHKLITTFFNRYHYQTCA